MRSFALAILASWLCLMSAHVMAGGAKAAPALNTKKLQYMEYLSARKIILRHGWKPFGGVCEGVDDKTCARFPEIDVCSGVSPGYCTMNFFRRDRCLFVLTANQQPGSNDTEVEEVTVGRGRCVRNVGEPAKLR